MKTNVCIVGAGPAGSIASLFLAKAGIPCVLIDKAVFPRDKICGDVLSGKVMDLLNELDPEVLHEFQNKSIQISSLGVKVIAPNFREFKVSIDDSLSSNKLPLALVSRRIDFDNFLVEKIRQKETIRLIEGYEILSYEKNNNGWVLKTADNCIEIHASLLIIANGAQSHFARQFGKVKKEFKHYYAGVRLYYSGVENLEEDNCIELYFLKDLLPGYFWIMPLPNNTFNVGLGTRSDIVKFKRINLRTKVNEIIKNHPILYEKFKNAKIISEAKGYGLPLGSKERKISGNHYILTGDAASLIDPFTGEGIGNAMISGKLAAKQAVKCITEGNYSEKFLKNYDIDLYKHLKTSFKLSKRMQKIAQHPWLLNAFIHTTIKSRYFANTISYMYVDKQMQRRLRNPFFYLKVIFFQWIGK